MSWLDRQRGEQGIGFEPFNADWAAGDAERQNAKSRPSEPWVQPTPRGAMLVLVLSLPVLIPCAYYAHQAFNTGAPPTEARSGVVIEPQLWRPPPQAPVVGATKRKPTVASGRRKPGPAPAPGVGRSH